MVGLAWNAKARDKQWGAGRTVRAGPGGGLSRVRTRGDHRFFHAKLGCGPKAEVLRGVEEEERWGSSILGWKWASEIGKAR